MKNRMAFLLAAVLMVSFTACSNGTEDNAETEVVSASAQTEETETIVSEPEETKTSASGEVIAEEGDSNESAEEVSDTNMLVVYFSYAENAALPDGVDASSTASIQVWNGETTGNTGVVASMIAEAVGADRFSIQTVEKYPDTYDATIDQGQEERNADARPELATHIENLEDYEVIFLGFPKMEQGFLSV